MASNDIKLLMKFLIISLIIKITSFINKCGFCNFIIVTCVYVCVCATKRDVEH